MQKSAALLALIFVFAKTNFAQNLTKPLYEKGREVLDKSVSAYGGLEKLRGIQNFSSKAVGDSIHRNQSRRPFSPDARLTASKLELMSGKIVFFSWLKAHFRAVLSITADFRLINPTARHSI
jgi:hypothetical protein